MEDERKPIVTFIGDDDHANVLQQALDIYVERNKDRGDAWKDAGWIGQLIEARKKLDRLWAIWRTDRTPSEKDIDEALDLINAVVFFVRCAEDNNKRGHWPWP